METPTVAWVEDGAQENCEDDEDVEAASCHLGVIAPSHAVVKTG